MKSDEELKELAQDFLDQKMFTSFNLTNPDLAITVFMPLAAMGPEFWQKLETGEVSMMYQYLSEDISDRCRVPDDGCPHFTSFQCLNKDEFEKFKSYVGEIEKSMKKV